MNSRNYIIDQLAIFSKKFKNYQFTYWHDSNFLEHFVEVVPDIFHNNADFVEDELNLVNQFYNSYPKESLAFITPEQRNMISEVENVMVFNSIINEWYKSIGLNDPIMDLTNSSDSEIPNYALAA
jgi:hypothetical protein